MLNDLDTWRDIDILSNANNIVEVELANSPFTKHPPRISTIELSTKLNFFFFYNMITFTPQDPIVSLVGKWPAAGSK